jgi:signal transduction histidine kinase
VEAAAYFVVSEALANVGKHAEAQSATVSVTAADGHLEVVVSDDGVGGAELGDGSGIQGLSDRVGALSGTLAMESPAGGGTRVLAEIPCES